MKKKSSAEFECNCEGLSGQKVKTKFDFVIPDVAHAILHDVTCQGCQSVWTIKFRKHLDGKVGFTFRLKEGSGKLEEFLKQKKIKEIINAPQKKSPIFVVPGFRK